MPDISIRTKTKPKFTPSPQAQAMNNLVPGAEIVGYGFDIFGDYSFDSAIKLLFDLGKPSTWTAPSGKKYDLPANVPTPGGSSSSARASYFASASDFVSYFQGSASVSGSVCGFSATFSSAYSTSQQDSSSNSWALVDADVISWHVGINYSPTIVLDEIKNDPDWKALPQTFDPHNRENTLAFFRFFQKFGTHFISNVAVGGSLYYYFSVSRDANYSAEQIEASASAEYHGLICSAQAEAQANWGHCAQGWTENRQSNAVTVPATSGLVDWVNPMNGSYDQGGLGFGKWKQEVTDYPSRCKFSLTPIWALFSGSQWLALQEAFAAYGSNRISVEAYRTGVATILVNDDALIPDGGYPVEGTQGWQLVVLDRKNLQVKLNKFYTMDYTQPNWPDPTCDLMAADIRPYSGGKDHLLIAATSNIDDACSPNTTLDAMFKSFGSGIGLDIWMARPNHGCGCGDSTAVYALVGAGNYVPGCEGFGDYFHVSPLMPATVVNINALLLPTGGNFTPTPYTP